MTAENCNCNRRIVTHVFQGFCCCRWSEKVVIRVQYLQPRVVARGLTRGGEEGPDSRDGITVGRMKSSGERRKP